MTYSEELLARLKYSINWPAFQSVDHLAILNDMADNTFAKGSFEGYLAAVTIYHQLCTDMIKLLLDDIRFLTQCSLYPFEIKFKKRKNAMFGSLLEELENNIEFDQKKELLKQCHKLNQIRITTVHKLTQQIGLGAVKRQAKAAKDVFDRIFGLFDEAHDHFRACLHDVQKDFLTTEIIDEAVYSEPSKGNRSKRPQQPSKPGK
jgi:hypothetical protein